MEIETNRPQTLDEALRVINEAMAKEGADLKELISADYSNLRMAIEDLAPRVSEQVRTAAVSYIEQAREAAGPQLERAVAGGKTVAVEVDRKVRENPYLVIGGVTLGAMALGYLWGKSQNSTPQKYTGLSYGDVVSNSEKAELA